MSEPVILFSSFQITQESLSDFLQSLGFLLTSENSFLGQLSRDGNLHIWVGLDNSVTSSLEFDDAQAISKRLKKPPMTGLVIEVSSDLESDALALEFAIAFAQQWRTVASYGYPEKLYQLEDLYNLRDSGKVFRQDS